MYDQHLTALRESDSYVVLDDECPHMDWGRERVRRHVAVVSRLMSTPIDVRDGQLSNVQRQRILDYTCPDYDTERQALMTVFLILMSLYVGVEETWCVAPQRCEESDTETLLYLVYLMSTEPPPSRDAFVAWLHMYQFMWDDDASSDSQVTMGDTSPSLVMSISKLAQLFSSDNHLLIIMITRSQRLRRRLYRMTRSEIRQMITITGLMVDLLPESDEELEAYMVVAATRYHRLNNHHSPQTLVAWWNFSAQYDNPLIVHEMCAAVSPDGAAHTWERVSREMTAPSIRGLAHGSSWYAMFFVQYALTFWSLDDALDRIIRAVNMRVPMTFRQFMALCEGFGSIRHVPDAWVMDILDIERATVAQDAIGSTVQPGDVVAMAMEDRMTPCVVTQVYRDTLDGILHVDGVLLVTVGVFLQYYRHKCESMGCATLKLSHDHIVQGINHELLG